MNTKQIIKKTALAGAILVGTSSAAQAGALASSVVELNNLTFSKTGGAILHTNDLAGLTYSSHSDTSVSLTGYASAVSTASSTNPTVAMDLYDCLGDCTLYTDNQFTANTLSSADGVPFTNYSIADQYELGSPIDGMGLTGANLGNASQAGVNPDAIGSSTSNNVLGATWAFSGYSGTIDIDFDLDYYLETFVTADALPPTNAHASYEVTWDLYSQGQLLWTSSIDQTLFSDSPWANGTAYTGCIIGTGIPCTTMGIDAPQNASIKLTTISMNAGQAYSLSATVETTADVEAVPEPTTLALLGISLLGFGAARKRRAA